MAMDNLKDNINWTITVQFLKMSVMTITLIVLSIGEAKPQKLDFFIREFTTDNGLPNNEIRAIAQDSDGFYWIGTWDGLARFDGYEFTNFYHDPLDDKSIGNSLINNIAVDENNYIWILGAQCFDRFDAANNTFFHYYDQIIRETKNNKYVSSIACDINGVLHVAADNTIYQYDKSSDQFKAIYNLNYFSTIEELDLITFDSNNKLWIHAPGNHNGYFNIIHKGHEIGVITELIAGSGYGNFRLEFSIKNNRFKEPALLSNCGGFRLNDGGLVEPMISDSKNVYNNVPNNSWFSDNNGLRWYRGDKEWIVVPFETSGFLEGGLIDLTNDIFLFGGIDSTFSGTGLKVVIPVNKHFNHWFTMQEMGYKTAIFSIVKSSSGHIYAGARNEPAILKTSLGEKITKIPTFYSDYNTYPRSLLVDKSDNIFVGLSRKFLLEYLSASKQFAVLHKSKTIKSWNNNRLNYKYLSFINDSTVLINCDTSLLIFDIYQKKVIRSIELSQSIKLFKKDKIRSFSPKGWRNVTTGAATKIIGQIYSQISFNGMHYVGVTGGFLLLFDSNLKLKNILRLGLSNIECIVLDKAGNLWLATLGGGLISYNPRTDSAIALTTKHGLSNNNTYHILIDKANRLWISTDHGLSCFDPTSMTFRNFNEKDGLLIDEFNSDAAFLAPDGEMYFGGVGGVVSFYPDSLMDRNSNAKGFLYIHSLRVSGKPLSFQKPTYQLDTAILQKGVNNFQISFGCINLKEGDKLRYRYKLINVDNQWIYVNHLNRNVSYAGLDPGIYKFHVEASDKMGLWNFSKTLTVVIPAMLYQELWFKFSSIILLGCIICLLLYLWYHNFMLHEKQVHGQLKLEALRSQLNPHFVFNSLNSINYFVLKADKESINQYIADFASLIRAILNNSREQFISLQAEIDTIQVYLKLEHLRFGDKFEYQLIVDNRIDTSQFEVAPGMIQPFIENAIWHGLRYLERRKGSLIVKFKLESADRLLCTIADDGIGMAASKDFKTEENRKRKSRGIQIIKERMDIMNHVFKTSKSIKISEMNTNTDERGTIVEVDLHFKKV
jgi:hypothetical protein